MAAGGVSDDAGEVEDDKRLTGHGARWKMGGSECGEHAQDGNRPCQRIGLIDVRLPTAQSRSRDHLRRAARLSHRRPRPSHPQRHFPPHSEPFVSEISCTEVQRAAIDSLQAVSRLLIYIQ